MGNYRHGTTVKTTKHYPRVTAGPLRHRYVHHIVAEALIGRDLRPDEEVHHRDQDRRNFHWRNLVVMGESDHGWVTRKQAWYMAEKDKQQKADWDQFMQEQANQFYQEVAEAKAESKPWQCEDGRIIQAWAAREAIRNGSRANVAASD